MNNADRCHEKQDNFVTRRIGGETIIVPIRGGVGELDSIYTLNEIGTRIWELIDGVTPVRRIADVISAEYEVSVEDAEKDLVDFMAGLEAGGLLKSARKGNI